MFSSKATGWGASGSGTGVRAGGPLSHGPVTSGKLAFVGEEVSLPSSVPSSGCVPRGGQQWELPHALLHPKAEGRGWVRKRDGHGADALGAPGGLYKNPLWGKRRK